MSTETKNDVNNIANNFLTKLQAPGLSTYRSVRRSFYRYAEYMEEHLQDLARLVDEAEAAKQTTNHLVDLIHQFREYLTKPKTSLHGVKFIKMYGEKELERKNSQSRNGAKGTKQVTPYHKQAFIWVIRICQAILGVKIDFDHESLSAESTNIRANVGQEYQINDVDRQATKRIGTAAGILVALPVMKVLSILKLLPKHTRRWFPKKKKQSRPFDMPSSDNMFENWLWKLLWMCYFVSTWALFALLIWNWKIGIKCGDSALGSALPRPKSLISMVDWSKLFTRGAAPPTVSNNTYLVYKATYSHKMASSLVNTICEHRSGVLNIQCGDGILDSILPTPTHLTTSVNWSELFINSAVLCAVGVCWMLIGMTYSRLPKARIIELGNHVAFMVSGDTTNQQTWWCYDIGASIHLSGDRKSFVSFHELPQQDRVPIRLVGGSLIEATGRGDIEWLGQS
ncbi:hypothetical protein BDR26DRAFT_944458 [Obelidium mucronatum]|nr:hypothetical protein BDR26DRAFT_944458 [Obelidium mucronatum]